MNKQFSLIAMSVMLLMVIGLASADWCYNGAKIYECNSSSAYTPAPYILTNDYNWFTPVYNSTYTSYENITIHLNASQVVNATTGNVIGYSSYNQTDVTNLIFTNDTGNYTYAEAVSTGMLISINSTAESVFFEPSGGVTTLYPGQAYWIYVSQEVDLTFVDIDSSYLNQTFPYTSLLFYNGSDELNFDDAGTAGWIDTQIFYFSHTGLAAPAWRTIPADTDNLSSWVGYGLYSYIDGLEMVFQEAAGVTDTVIYPKRDNVVASVSTSPFIVNSSGLASIDNVSLALTAYSLVYIASLDGTTYHVDSLQSQTISQIYLDFNYDNKPDYVEHYYHNGSLEGVYYDGVWTPDNCSAVDMEDYNDTICYGTAGTLRILVNNVDYGVGSNTFPIGTSGATWTNDGVLGTLVSGVDYTVNVISGVITFSSNYLYNLVVFSWMRSEDSTGGAMDYAQGLMGASGFMGWLPAIIALIIGLFFLTSFIAKGKNPY